MLNRNDRCHCGSGLRYKNCCGAIAVAPHAAGPDSWRLMASALAEQRAGRIAAAEALYRAALDVAPGDPDALHMLGVSEYQDCRYWDAFAHVRAALDATGWRVDAMRYNLALVLRELLGGDESAIALRTDSDPRRDAIDAARARLAEAPRAQRSGTAAEAGLRPGRARVLVIDTAMPKVDRDSGSVRITALMRLMVELGCRVTFVSDGIQWEGDSVEALRQAGVEVVVQPVTSGVGEYLARSGAMFDVFWLCRHRTAAAWLPAARRANPRALAVFDTVDLHHLRESRAAALTGDSEAHRRAALAHLQEQALAREADATIAVTELEATLIARDAPSAQVRVISNVHRCSDGPVATFEERADVVFVGSYEHPPNVDAATWFVREIWPLARVRLPGVRVRLVGSGMTADVRALASHDVEAVGHVAELDALLDRSRVAVAPLRFGAGAKGKITLAQSRGLPVVATSIGVEGMHLVAGDDVLVADEPAAFAEAVVAACSRKDLWSSLSARGLRNVARHFAPDVAKRELDALIASATARRRACESAPVATSRGRALVLLPAGAGSLGDEAMLRGLVEGAAREYPGIAVDVLSLSPGERWCRVPGVADVLNAAPAAHPPGAWERHFAAMLAGYDCYAVLGADVLDGYYALRQSLETASTLRIAAASGKRTTVLGFSFNASAPPEAVAALRVLASNVTLCVRDGLSRARLDKAGVAPLTDVADLAFLMPAAAASEATAPVERWIAAQRDAAARIVVVNVSAAFLREAPADAHGVLPELATLLAHLASDRSVAVLLMPHDLRPAAHGTLDDVAAACRLAERLRAMAPLLPHKLYVPVSAPEAKRIAGCADLVITGRMHLAVAALGMGTPAVGLGYQDKFEGLFTRFGMEDAVVDARAFAMSRLADVVRRTLDSLGASRARIAAHLPGVREAALANVRHAFGTSS